MGRKFWIFLPSRDHDHAYAVLEANGKVNGIGENSHPYSSQTHGPIGCRFKYITTSVRGVHVPTLIKIDSAVASLYVREKTRLRVVFLFTYLLYLRIYISVLRHAYRPHFSVILTLNGSYDVFLQPLASFGVHDEIAQFSGSNPPYPSPILGA